MSYETLTVQIENNIATLTLNRPPVNALNRQMFKDLAAAADELKVNQSVKAVIITGSGEKAFCAGADVSEMVNLTPTQVYEFCQISSDAFSKIESLDKPIIAAMRGLVLGGGCELSLTCDFRIAAENAKFAQPEINLGIIPGAGGTQRLPRLIGVARAKELLFLGGMIDANTAERYGLVNKVVPESQLMEEAQELAHSLAAKPAAALNLLKKTVNTGINIDLTYAAELEIKNFVLTTTTDDAKEGMKALLEKRKPNFVGK